MEAALTLMDIVQLTEITMPACKGLTMLDPTRLRTLKQFAAEAPAFTLRYLRWLIAKADEKGFERCFVKVSGRVFIDPVAVAEWLTTQQAQPQPHQRGVARKRLALTRHQHDLTV